MVEDLTTAYGSIEALHGVSFAVPKGEVVAVLGANGAGKTHPSSHHLGLAAAQGRVRSSTKVPISPGSPPTRSRPRARARCRKAGSSSASCRCRTTWWWALRARGLARQARRRHRLRLRAVPDPGRAAQAAGRAPSRGRAADAGHRPGAHRAAATAAPGRAFHGSRAAGGGAHLRGSGQAEQTGPDHADGGAERGDGALAGPPGGRTADRQRRHLGDTHRAPRGRPGARRRISANNPDTTRVG